MADARKMKREAVETVLRAYYPRVCRIAAAFCGQADGAKAVAKTVMGQCLRSLPWWQTEPEATNWFLHHTVLTTRELGGAGAANGEDCLIGNAALAPPEQVAFVKALRLLPVQQQEAFLLLRGERLDPRQTGVAMDCSTGAAENHHIAATKTLTAIAAGTFDLRTAELARVYASLTPPEEMMVGDIGAISMLLVKRKSKKIFRKIVLLALLAAIAWTIWRLSRMIVV